MGFLYNDKNKSTEERINDLVSQMTLEEKVRQLDQYAGGDITYKDASGNMVIDYEKLNTICGGLGFGAIQNRGGDAKINNEIQRYVMEHSRLGIPVLFCEEGLHGFFYPGCTVFPQQIMLASTFDSDLAEKTGHAMASEAAALGVHEVWAPVMDLAREPRWGRTEETYGEDTYLGSRFAAKFVKGMQGDDVAKPDRVISEPKHFTGYGAPIGGLNCMPAAMGRHEHHMFALPIFEAAFTESGAVNTMCSYSSIDGIPVAADYQLLTQTLRDDWKMPGFVRSDMCAIAMLMYGHDVADSKEEAIRQALEAGVDMQLYDFPHDFYQESILNLVNSGKLSESVVDRAVSRILRVKMIAGLFDSPYTEETLHTCIHSEKHQELAYDVAKKGICLLKNTGILPLKKDIKTIAVIGPSADEARLGDYTVPPVDYKPVTLLDGIKQAVSPDTTVLYSKGCNILDTTMMPIPAKWLQTPDGEEGLMGEYFNDPISPSGTPVMTRTDNKIQFNWIYYKPADQVDAEFSVRWTGYLVPDKTFSAYIGTSSTDSMKLWIDDTLIVDGWAEKDATQMVPFDFEVGKRYKIKIEYRNDNRGARVIFGFSYGNELIADAVAAARKADAAIVALGDNEETSGENLDRSDLNLPGRQLELLKAIYETKTPVILVLQNGRPMTINWEAEYLPGIVEAWFPGEQGGKAIADVLFGDYNPAGRLPMSFPRSIGQLPVCYNRKASGGKRYVEFDWSPLYPFGYGLSYTEFTYSNLKLSSETITTDGILTVSFDVTNIGKLDGEEVAQLYIHDYFSSVVRPVKELRGFSRIFLKAGETKSVTMKLGPYELRTLTPSYEWVVEPGKVNVMVGPNSADIKLEKEFEILAK